MGAAVALVRPSECFDRCFKGTETARRAWAEKQNTPMDAQGGRESHMLQEDIDELQRAERSLVTEADIYKDRVRRTND
jgi:hypothetical protein